MTATIVAGWEDEQMLDPEGQQRGVVTHGPDADCGLREHRRRETRRAITDAALDLFERQGVPATSVEAIADAAGIAPRTFYRHAGTKENALFVDDDSMERLIASLRGVDQRGPAVVRAIEQAFLAQIDAFDAQPAASHARVLRVRRLVLADPDLLARALARDAEQVQELTTIVLHASDHPDELRARTVVTAIGTAVRLAYDEWARRAERGEVVPSRSLYLQVRSGLVEYFTGAADG
ncbi:TetR/AcrR family transcriptional regulator [Cellulomonas wangsupingiae]|uniref:TetR/AcrR family transcriptional regulator n=1 Tax=Cellulomonas wangsupingiae TaxID=2968085 RepID=A0ABY5K4B5_9CELL|nr:TetR/AcrR family transcriptional regulator [Cellulomonas wangsupingiae]MCC2336093.1 TetR/AcrR family transcriptional regulator [Cellulomonas wangsupingiae]UUI64815.1 TetR/AcrR family transcriptional regulator [Cellulomonas wangsupingiae]